MANPPGPAPAFDSDPGKDTKKSCGIDITILFAVHPGRDVDAYSDFY
jgi:hypothetical protein